MERPEEESAERETQDLSAAPSRASGVSAQSGLTARSSDELGPEGLVHKLLQRAVPSPASSRDRLLASLMSHLVGAAHEEGTRGKEAFVAALGEDLLRRALPSPTSSQELRRGVVEYRRSGLGEGEPAPATPDCEYLRRHLGEPLTAALAEVAAKRPQDPIHYLGHWLYRWRAECDLREEKKEKMRQLDAERARVAAERRAREEELRRARVLRMAGELLEEAFDRSLGGHEPEVPEEAAAGEEEAAADEEVLQVYNDD